MRPQFSNYSDVIKQLSIEGNPVPARRFSFSIPNAKAELKGALSAVLESMGEKLVWLEEYDRVAEWMSNNQGKGLLLYGVYGRGKSLLVRYAIPMIFRTFLNRIVTIVDCGSPGVNIDNVLTRKFIGLDDIGVEADRMEFGTKRNIVVEVLNKAQDNTDTLIIASTNLSSDKLRDRYGDRILDRIKYLCYRIPFNGNSLRK